MQTPVTFELRLHGEGIRPETTSLKELVAILSSVERAIGSLVSQYEQPSDEDLVLGLVDVRRSSNVLQFASNRPQETANAWFRFAGAIANRDFHSLPPPAIKSVLTLLGYSKRRNAVVALADRPKQPPLAEIRPNFDLFPPTPIVSGETTIYGMVFRVGGKDPRITLALDTGETVNCEADLSVAKVVARNLYEQVGLEGIAHWNTEDWTITSFRATRVVEFIPTPLTDAIAALARASGPDAWSDEVDVVEAIAVLRKDQ